MKRRGAPLPSDSRAAAVRWSAGAALVLLVWATGVLAAGATQFSGRYTFPQLVKAIADNFGHAVWPGEYGAGGPWWMWSLQVGPALGACLWIFCLVPWRSRAARLASVLAALLVPAWFIVVVPWCLPFAAFMVVFALFGELRGEEYQQGHLLFAGAALWWYLLGTLGVLTARRRSTHAGVCHTCGYSLAGLPVGTACPECGKR